MCASAPPPPCPPKAHPSTPRTPLPLPSQHYALTRAAQLLKPGGYAVISHPEGRAWHSDLRASSPPGLIPHGLPDAEALGKLLFESPFELVELRDEPQLYLAVLKVTS